MENIKNTVSPQYKWNLNNPETVKTAQSTYIKNNRDKILVKKRLAYRKDITKSRELGIKYAKLYRMRHPEKIRERAALYRKNNKEKIAKRDKVYQSKHVEKIKEYQKQYRKEYYKKNKTRCRYLANKYRRNRVKYDINYKLNMLLSSKIKKGLRRIPLGYNHNWREDLGYTASELKEYLQSKFTKGMNWKNHGTYWEIDHIIPISWFKTRQQIITRGWRLDNLQPLEKELNASKNNQFAGNPKTSNGVIYL
jgi:5-methylcytosine-specific restriction endonuclease McrA